MQTITTGASVAGNMMARHPQLATEFKFVLEDSPDFIGVGAAMAETTQHSDRDTHPVLIAGGGIGGMATALTLNQLGVPCVVLESVAELAPLGAGISLQPNAVREL